MTERKLQGSPPRGTVGVKVRALQGMKMKRAHVVCPRKCSWQDTDTAKEIRRRIERGKREGHWHSLCVESNRGGRSAYSVSRSLVEPIQKDVTRRDHPNMNVRPGFTHEEMKRHRNKATLGGVKSNTRTRRAYKNARRRGTGRRNADWRRLPPRARPKTK